MNTTKVIAGLLAGIAAGAALGILFAPDKGAKTRKRIFRKGADTVDEIKDRVDDLLNDLTESFQAAKDEVGELLYQKGKKKAAELAGNSVKN